MFATIMCRRRMYLVHACYYLHVVRQVCVVFVTELSWDGTERSSGTCFAAAATLAAVSTGGLHQTCLSAICLTAVAMRREDFVLFAVQPVSVDAKMSDTYVGT